MTKPIYEPSEKDKKNLENNFTHHPPQKDQYIRYEQIRERAKDFAAYLIENCPPSRELSLSLTNLEQSVMWANAAIARNE